MTKKKIKIVEVGPRDGLQNERIFIPTPIKLEFIKALSESGLQTIETSAFVSPRWVPQMADHQEVAAFTSTLPNLNYPVLIPNKEGMLKAVACGVKQIAVFTTVSETFSQKNTHCDIATSLLRIDEVLSIANDQQIPTRAYLSCVLGCPYEGSIDPKRVATMTSTLLSMGVEEVSLGDTIGLGDSVSTHLLLDEVIKVNPPSQIAVHFHDTHKRAITNIEVALSKGIQTIDSAAGGLGGCPFAPGASGNVATEQVIDLLDRHQLHHGVDKSKIIKAGNIIKQFLSSYSTRTPENMKP